MNAMLQEGPSPWVLCGKVRKCGRNAGIMWGKKRQAKSAQETDNRKGGEGMNTSRPAQRGLQEGISLWFAVQQACMDIWVMQVMQERWKMAGVNRPVPAVRQAGQEWAGDPSKPWEQRHRQACVGVVRAGGGGHAE